MPGFTRNWSFILAAFGQIRSADEATNGPPAFCIEDGIAPIKYTELKSCNHWLVMDRQLPDDLLYYWQFFAVERGYVPIFTFFYSSLTLTFILYMAFLASWFVRTQENSYRIVGPLGGIFSVESYPFSLLFALLGIPLLILVALT